MEKTMKIKVAIKPRQTMGPKIEISSLDGKKLFTVIDETEVRQVNKPPKEKKFHVDLIADELVVCKQYFNQFYSDLEKLPMYLPPGFENAISTVAVEAAKRNLEFKPYMKMLRALYRDTENLALYLKRLDKDLDFDELFKYSDIFKIDSEKRKKNLTPYARICAELLGVKDFYKQFCQIAADSYGKQEHSVLRKHFEGYAIGQHEPSNWICATALEVISRNGINVFDIGVDRELIIETWLKSNSNRKDQISEIFGTLS